MCVVAGTDEMQFVFLKSKNALPRNQHFTGARLTHLAGSFEWLWKIYFLLFSLIPHKRFETLQLITEKRIGLLIGVITFMMSQGEMMMRRREENWKRFKGILMHHRRHDANANAAACGLHYVELSCEVASCKMPINSIMCKNTKFIHRVAKIDFVNSFSCFSSQFSVSIFSHGLAVALQSQTTFKIRRSLRTCHLETRAAPTRQLQSSSMHREPPCAACSVQK